MIGSVLVRPMTPEDIDAAYLVASAAFSETAEEKERVRNRSAEEVKQRQDRYRLALEHDPGGTWVAADGERIAGVAVALAREGVWVLSLLAVDAEYRGAGVGRALIGHALETTRRDAPGP